MPTELLRHRDRQAMLFAGALLLVTYLVFTIRTTIDPVDPGQVLSAKRLVASVAGGGIFWFLAIQAKPLSLQHLRVLRLRHVAGLTLAAFGAMLASRIGYDAFAQTLDESLIARNIRWVVTWSGYFLAALLGYRMTILQRLATWQSQVVPYETPSQHALARPYEEADPIADELRQ